jgi:hypothetical protein
MAWPVTTRSKVQARAQPSPWRTFVDGDMVWLGKSMSAKSVTMCSEKSSRLATPSAGR